MASEEKLRAQKIWMEGPDIIGLPTKILIMKSEMQI